MKIFIVDDEFLQRQLVKKTVDWELLGMEIIGEAEDGEEALEKVKQLQPDILIMDINIPYINGIEVSKRIKEKFPDIQIIILTAYGEFEYARQAISLGAVSFVLKPVNPEELTREILKCRKKMEDIWEQRDSIHRLEQEVVKKEKEQRILEKLSGVGLPEADKDADMLRAFLERGMSILEQQKISSTRKKVQEAKIFIDENFERFDMSLNVVAEAVGVNSSYLSNIFKKELGVSLSRYIMSVRLAEARKLLGQYPNRTLIEIAEAVGYTDVYYFSKNFKSCYGIAPSKYQEEQQS